MIDTIRLVYDRLSQKEQQNIVIHKNSTKGAIEFYEDKGKCKQQLTMYRKWQIRMYSF